MSANSDTNTGDFRNVVVTNPPFSLFREYVKQLMDYGKKFIIIGNGNAVNCKEIFPLIRDNKIWLGHKSFSGGMNMYAGPSYDADKCKHPKYDENGRVIINVMMCVWYTNVEHTKRHTPIDLYKKYSNEYPKYDNYDAIEVKTYTDIPMDYDGIMGVPITFLDKYCPEQFEILGSTQRGCHDLVPDTKKYDDYREVKQDGTFTGSSGNKTNENANLAGIPSKGNYFINNEGKSVHSLYGRIFIRKRTA